MARSWNRVSSQRVQIDNQADKEVIDSAKENCIPETSLASFSKYVVCAGGLGFGGVFLAQGRG